MKFKNRNISKLSLFVCLVHNGLESVSKYAFITGVSRGIGYELAKNLLNRDICVVGVARAPITAIPELVAYKNFTYFPTDLASSSGLAALEQYISSNAYIFDLVVHNAAVVSPGYLEQMDPYILEQGVAINLLAPLKLTRILAPTYRHFARIAFISSGASEQAIEQLGTYCVSKAGVAMLAQLLRVEYAKHELGIVSIMPGIVDTAMQSALRENTNGDTQEMFQELYDQGELRTSREAAAFIAKLLCDIPYGTYKKKSVWDIDEEQTVRSKLRSFFRKMKKIF